MRIRSAVIAGTGIGDLLNRFGGRAVCVPTPFGPMRGRIAPVEGEDVLLIRRHSAGHKVPPHKVAYQAMAAGARRLGVERVFATAAVGSLRADWGTGTLAVAEDFVDLAARNITLFDRTVEHTDFSSPFPAGDQLRRAAGRLGTAVQPSAVYVCGNGPRYETPAEVTMMGKVGDLAGMTSATEAVVFREAGIDYGLICVVTNLGTGIQGERLEHGDVVRVMTEKGEAVLQIILEALRSRD